MKPVIIVDLKNSLVGFQEQGIYYLCNGDDWKEDDTETR